MKENIFWKGMLLLLISASIRDCYFFYTEPEILQPEHPIIVSVFAFVLDILTIIACAAIITRKVICNAHFWLFIIIVQIAITVLIVYYEFNAGGYTTNEMLVYGNITFFVAIFFLTPLIKYYRFVKQSST